MRRFPNFFYYFAGTICLAFSVFLIFNMSSYPERLANNMVYHRIDTSYRSFYDVNIPPYTLNQDALRQAGVYLPIYSITYEEDLGEFLSSFSMEHATITPSEDYFVAKYDGRLLRVYKNLDLIEFEQSPSSLSTDPFKPPITNNQALDIANHFIVAHSFLQQPFSTHISREAGIINITFTPLLGKIENQAFPTTITLDEAGNVLHFRHFYFEYEELARGDIITAHMALSYLPQDHIEQITITGYHLAYVFEESILQPAYIFKGHYPDGSPFESQVSALRFY
ncbi:MAG: hypothetical protein FWC69_06520 [Defluviitaleaceae bacterium]|nr:hypothetical protein [Defluviitaleaceae bacterium]